MGKDYRKVDLKGVPVRTHCFRRSEGVPGTGCVPSSAPPHGGYHGESIPETSTPERQTGFRVEQIVVLSDEQYRQFQESGLVEDQIFLFDYNDKMWFDPGDPCWHCVLVKVKPAGMASLWKRRGIPMPGTPPLPRIAAGCGCGMPLSTMNTQQKRRSK